MLFLTGAIVGVFTVAGPAALLRLLRGDADPALRADRRVGRAGAARRDDQVRRLHDGRLAADARGDHRARPPAGDVRPDRRAARARTTGSSSGSPPRSRSRRRSSRSTAGCPTPTASRRPRSPPCCRASSRRRPRSASCGSCIPIFPGPVQDFADADPRARGGRARLRLAARVPRARHPRRDRVLVAGADGADHARPVRAERPGLRRRRAADGQPRAVLAVAVPARGRGRAAHGDRATSRSSAGWRRAGPRSRRC